MDFLRSLFHDVATLESRVEKSLTLFWHEIEHWQRDNPEIHSGYRPASNSYWDSILSLSYLHNETVNIYTHLLGALVTLLSCPLLYRWLVHSRRYASASREDVAVFSCFLFGCVACLGVSGSFHLFSNHSAEVARLGNQLDYLGIVVLIWGSFIPSIYYGFAERVDLVRAYWGMITFIGVLTGYASISPQFRGPTARVIRSGLYVAMGLSAMVPLGHGVVLFGINKMRRTISFTWLFFQGVFYISGAGIYAMRFPERYAPGRFDIWGSSHQIFHFLVLLAAGTHFVGLLKAFDYRHSMPEEKVPKVGINVKKCLMSIVAALGIISQVARFAVLGQGMCVVLVAFLVWLGPWI